MHDQLQFNLKLMLTLSEELIGDELSIEVINNYIMVTKNNGQRRILGV